MHKPFDVFYKRNNPDRCQVCAGQGAVQAIGTIIRKPLVVDCMYCNGTGKSDAPLFTDEDSADYEAWRLKGEGDEEPHIRT